MLCKSRISCWYHFKITSWILNINIIFNLKTVEGVIGIIKMSSIKNFERN